MYWLLFHNGSDVPSIECSFLTPFMLVEYVTKLFPADYCSSFIVLTPNQKAIPLNKFIKLYKED